MAKKKTKAKSRSKSVRVSKKKPARKSTGRAPVVRKAVTKRGAQSKRKPARKSSRAPIRKPVPVYLSGLAPWYQVLASDRDRRGTISYLKDSLKKVRKIYSGFDSKDGFDFKYLDRLPTERYEDLRDHAREVRAQMAHGEEFGKQEWIIVRPRTKAQKEALIRHTVEGLGTRAHPRKAFIIETGTPTKDYVQYVKQPIVKGWRRPVLWGTGIPAEPEPILEEGLRVEVVTPLPGGDRTQRDYIFAEILGWQPGLDIQKTLEGSKFLGLPTDPWEQMKFAVNQMAKILPAKTPGGKDAYYQLLSQKDGPITSAVTVDDLFFVMQDYSERYREDFASVIIGLRYVGTEAQVFDPKRGKLSTMERRRAAYRKTAKRVALARKRLRLPAPKKSKRKQQRKHK